MNAIISPTVLHIDLSTKRTWTEKVPEETAELLLGARGLNAKILWDLACTDTDPLDPKNPLIFGAGALCGTHAPTAGRTTVTTQSPATGIYLKSSVGGHFGAEMKRAGFGGIVVRGKAEVPTLLIINDSEVKFVNAGFLWGKDTRETVSIIQEEYGTEFQVACIGPAGENLVKFSSIMFNMYNAAGRGGVGAVMGSKYLKAVAVKGTGAITVHDPKGYHEYAVRLRHALAEDNASKSLSKYGTAGIVQTANNNHGLTAFNFQKGSIDGVERLTGQYLVDKGYLKRRVACDSCGTACHRFTSVDQGLYKGTYSGGPEYETLAALGAGCGLTDTDLVLKANETCNLLGMDTISAGSVIGWAMESWQRGLLSERNTRGMDLGWGNGEAIVQLLYDVAHRKGFGGEYLSDGVKEASERLGGDSWKWAVQAKGLEQSRVETRLRMGYALGFAVNPRGPDHLTTEVVAESARTPEGKALIAKITGSEKYATPLITDKRAEIVLWHEDCYAVTDALGLCAFSTTMAYAVTPKAMARLFSLATGTDMSEEKIMEAGRRIFTLEKCFNARLGKDRKDDKLPYRIMHDPVQEGPNKGFRNSPEILDMMLDHYYSLHGWDAETGLPFKSTLDNLALYEQAEVLEKMGRLPG